VGFPNTNKDNYQKPTKFLGSPKTLPKQPELE